MSCTYPGTSRLVLNDLSVILPAGTVVAVVGENGAGGCRIQNLRQCSPGSIPFPQLAIDILVPMWSAISLSSASGWALRAFVQFLADAIRMDLQYI
ncbi:MAG TPA: hypothetical protein VJX16_25235 [Terriglobales bacterium]|nr:hypothetical protein [Terriglobales bacterium]